MKTNDIRVIKLIKEGFAFETLRNLNESQINILYKRIIKESSEPKEATTQTVKKTTYSKSEVDKMKRDEGGLNVNGTVSPNDDGSVTVTTSEEISEDDVKPLDPYKGQQTQDPKQVGPSTNDGTGNYQDGMDEGEIEEKAVSKQQQKFMGLVKAYKEGDVDSSEVTKKVKDAAKSMTKKEVDDFASTKHKGLPKKVEESRKNDYLRSVKQIEKTLMELVQKNIPKKMTKEEFMRMVEQNNPSISPSQPTIKPGTPTKPGNPERKSPYKPKHKPAPKAKDKDDETFAMKLPKMLQFDKLNIKFKDEKEG